jgi:hypothetical protein
VILVVVWLAVVVALGGIKNLLLKHYNLPQLTPLRWGQAVQEQEALAEMDQTQYLTQPLQSEEEEVAALLLMAQAVVLVAVAVVTH